jgi:hypothetical protein
VTVALPKRGKHGVEILAAYVRNSDVEISWSSVILSFRVSGDGIA